MLRELFLLLGLFNAEKIIITKDKDKPHSFNSVQAILLREEGQKMMKEENNIWKNYLVFCNPDTPCEGKDTYTFKL